MENNRIKDAIEFSPVHTGDILFLTDFAAKTCRGLGTAYNYLADLEVQAVDLGENRVVFLHEDLQDAIRTHRKCLKRRKNV